MGADAMSSPIDGYSEGKKSIIVGNKPPAPLHPTPPSTTPPNGLRASMMHKVEGGALVVGSNVVYDAKPTRAEIENEVLGLLLKFKNHRITFDDAVQQLTDRIHKSDNA
jgi:hypothetical protein